MQVINSIAEVMRGSSQVTSIWEIINKEWRVVVNHIGRDRNRVADKLISRGHGKTMALMSFFMPSVDIASLVEELLGCSPTTLHL
ncbi:hypothetical protein V6N12_014227 [Hibiscus sabdariffa]|uniref:RNase H type-1 domain-containing protein n=1 Tax=Hibiscus sabdariffa TaxID=183260 RepID=A0ABR2DJJ8_9ROSI